MKACDELNLLERCENVDEVASETTYGLASKTAARNHHPTPNPASASPTTTVKAHAPPGRDKANPAPARKTADPLDEDLFQGFGGLHNHEYGISLRTDVEPAKCPPRTVPHKAR